MSKTIFLIILSLALVLTGCQPANPAIQNGTYTPVSNPIQNGTPSPAAGPLQTEPKFDGGEMIDGMLGMDFHSAVFDKDNVLWLGTAYGLGGIITACYENKFQIFDRYNTNLPSAHIMQIVVDDRNVKWFGSLSGDVFTFDGHEWQTLSTPENVRIIMFMNKAPDGKVWVMGEAITEDNHELYIVWSYKDRQLENVFLNNQFNNDSLTGMAIDSNNRVYVSTTHNGIFRYNDSTWEKFNYDLPDSSIRTIYYNQTNKVLYCTTYGHYVGAQYVENGIYALSDNGFEPLSPVDSGLTSQELIHGKTDNLGNLWFGLAMHEASAERPLIEFDGENWQSYGAGTPFEGWNISQVIVDNMGQTWVYGHDSSQNHSGLALLKGETWQIYPVLGEDPRIWWRKQSLAELYKIPVTDVSIQEVLKNPIPYRGKKLRIVGRIENISAFFRIIVDMESNKLDIWPHFASGLFLFLKDYSPDGSMSKSLHPYELTSLTDYEFIGFLEFGGAYGPTNTFYTTEVYQYTINKEQSKKSRMVYAEYIQKLEKDKQDILALVDRWTSALKSGDIEALKQVYHPGEFRYQTLLNTSGQNEVKQNPMDITIKDMSLELQGDTAELTVLKAEVKPDKYFKPINNVRARGDGLYILREIQFKKYEAEWKITTYNYSPAYESPTTTISTSSPNP